MGEKLLDGSIAWALAALVAADITYLSLRWAQDMFETARGRLVGFLVIESPVPFALITL